MPNFRFKALLQNDGWVSPAYVCTDAQGDITSIASDKKDGQSVEDVNGYAVPGFQNAHSHAFQYAMAGIAESHKSGADADDFWSWREAMYKVALRLDPQQLEDVAAMLYAEMVRHGYTNVAEFHYLHHDKDGKRYANLAEMGERLVAAAHKAGIKITLVPMFYQQGGFGHAPLEHQRRFISPTIEDYYELFERTKKTTQEHAHSNYGFGIHSLRAVRPEDIIKILNELNEKIPVHIHISEQLKEIEDAKTFLQARPVEWLLNNCPVSEQYHLVHATHLVENEVQGIANCGAHVVLCPSTEGNLGDGLFPLNNYQDIGGKWSIGTDSHIGLNPLEELRLLDYGQRLTTHKRNIFNSVNENDSGKYAFNQALLAGRMAMNNGNRTYFGVGQPLDAAVYDGEFPLFAMSSLDSLLSTILYCGDASSILGTLVDASWIVKHTAHNNKDNIFKQFATTIQELDIR